jgi:hypothetical protein
MSTEVAIIASVLMIGTAAASLFVRKMSVSLIMMFYSSVILGIIFTMYGSVIVGLLHITTFAGAVTVMLLTVILMTGESDLNIGARKSTAAMIAATLVAVAAAAYSLLNFTQFNLPVERSTLPISLLQFLWDFRPWDLLILVMVFAAAMIVVVNLFSRES